MKILVAGSQSVDEYLSRESNDPISVIVMTHWVLITLALFNDITKEKMKQHNHKCDRKAI